MCCFRQSCFVGFYYIRKCLLKMQKHGSWLNMTEIEFSILARQCLDRRLPDIESVRREVDAWAKARSEVRATVQWRFTTADARLTFRRFYHQ